MCFDAFEGVFGREIYIYIYRERERDMPRKCSSYPKSFFLSFFFFLFFFFFGKMKGLGVFIGQN